MDSRTDDQPSPPSAAAPAPPPRDDEEGVDSETDPDAISSAGESNDSSASEMSDSSADLSSIDYGSDASSAEDLSSSARGSGSASSAASSTTDSRGKTFGVPSGPDVPCATCGNQAAIERTDQAGRSLGATCVVCPYAEKMGIDSSRIQPEAGRFLEGLLTLKVLRKDSLAKTRRALYRQLKREGGEARVAQFNQLARRLRKAANRGLPRAARLTGWFPTRRMNRQMINTALMTLLDNQGDAVLFADQVIAIMAEAFDSRPGVLSSEATYRSRAMFKAIVKEFGAGGEIPNVISFVGAEHMRVQQDADEASGSDASSYGDSSSLYGTDDEATLASSKEPVDQINAIRLGKRRLFKGYSTRELSRSMLAFLAGAERRLSADGTTIGQQVPMFGQEIARKFAEYRPIIEQQRQRELFVDFIQFLSQNFSPTYQASVSAWKNLSMRAKGAAKAVAKSKFNMKEKTASDKLKVFKARKNLQNVDYRKSTLTVWGLYQHYAKIPKLRTQVRLETRERTDVRRDIQAIYKATVREYSKVQNRAYAVWAVDALFVGMFNALLDMFDQRPLPIVPQEEFLQIAQQDSGSEASVEGSQGQDELNRLIAAATVGADDGAQ